MADEPEVKGHTSETPGPAASFRSADAFNDSLRAQFRNRAAASGVSSGELHRYFAYDRMLARLMVPEPDGSPPHWVLQGGVGLLARLGTSRHTKDVDLTYRDAPSATAEEMVGTALDALVADLGRDLGDMFGFDVEGVTGDVVAAAGAQATVVVRLGDRVFEKFSIDLMADVHYVNTPDMVNPLTPASVPGLVTHPYQVYPLADLVADKTMATVDRYGRSGLPSTRYRDLVDLVAISNTCTLDAAELRASILSEQSRRGIVPFGKVESPGPYWESGYAKIAAHAPHVEGYRDLDAALRRANSLLEPVLSGRVTSGTWDPQQGWVAKDGVAVDEAPLQSNLGADRESAAGTLRTQPVVPARPDKRQGVAASTPRLGAAGPAGR